MLFQYLIVSADQLEKIFLHHHYFLVWVFEECFLEDSDFLFREVSAFMEWSDVIIAIIAPFFAKFIVILGDEFLFDDRVYFDIEVGFFVLFGVLVFEYWLQFFEGSSFKESISW